jgi:hypothetical protein
VPLSSKLPKGKLKMSTETDNKKPVSASAYQTTHHLARTLSRGTVKGVCALVSGAFGAVGGLVDGFTSATKEQSEPLKEAVTPTINRMRSAVQDAIDRVND